MTGQAEEELLDIVDEDGNPTGETVERGRAHREGIRHRTSHVWLLRRRAGRVDTDTAVFDRQFPGYLRWPYPGRKRLYRVGDQGA